MKAKHLTKAERDWIKKLQGILDECPSERVGAYTIGDPFLHIYARRFEGQINESLNSGRTDFSMAVSDLGADLHGLKMPFPVHSTAG